MATSIDFNGKVALVTGGARGIGEAAALAMAEAGANVLLVDMLPEVEQTAEKISAATGASCSGFIGDLTDPSACQAMVKTVLERYGRLDFAFNNAGIGGESGVMHEMPDEHWQKVMDVNLNSMFYCIKHEVSAMLEGGGGVIINTSSICGRRAVPKFGHYTATKHGVVALTKQIAVEYSDRGIRSMAIAPGYIVTEMTEKSAREEEGHKEALISRIPQGRLGSPADIGRVVRLLCSDDASYINGAYLPVDGGMLEV